MNELTLKIQHTINAPIEQVFNAWLDPKLLAQFMIPVPGAYVPVVEVEPQEGGRFQLVMAGEGGVEIHHAGEYLKITPFTQIIFTWESPYSMEGSTVTLNFQESTRGTRIELVQIKFVDVETQDGHRQGWGSMLAMLEKVLLAQFRDTGVNNK